MGKTVEFRSTNGFYFFVDESVASFVRRFEWTADKHKGQRMYLYTSLGGRKVYLHRLLVGLFGNFVVDHVNNKWDDNTLGNLDVTTYAARTAGTLLRAEAPTCGWTLLLLWVA